MSRVKKLTKFLPVGHGIGLEIGALFKPIVPPQTKGIYYADHLSTNELRQKYAGDREVDIDALVPVTYICKDQSLLDAVGHAKFDYIIASHVIEHIPNPVRWFMDIASMLNAGGKLALAIPDMRYVFDCKRQLTSFADVVDAFIEERMRPSFRQVLDYLSGVADVPGSASPADLWSGKIKAGDVPLKHPGIIADFCEEWFRSHYDAIKGGTYIDVHCSVFTPESFRQILTDLSDVGLFSYEIVSFDTTAYGDMEFFITLEPKVGSKAG